MTVAETSRQHYKDLVDQGKIGDQCQKVYETMKKLDGDVTINELGNTMALEGMDNSTISGRLNDLKDADLVQDFSGDAKRKDKFSGIKCKVWEIVDEQQEDEWVSISEDVELEEDAEDPLFINANTGEPVEISEETKDKVNKPEPGEVIWS